MFLSLPDPIDYQDYYQIIQVPMALDMIAHRIHSPFYKSLAEFISDFKLMFDNALLYNQEGSQVYNDALCLKAVFEEQLKSLCPEGILVIEEEDKESKSYSKKRPTTIIQQGSSENESNDETSHFKLKLNVSKKRKMNKEEEEEAYQEEMSD